MKKHISILLLTMSTAAFAQEGRVGINTTSPKTTMDVSGKTANMDGSGTVLATDMTGLQAPRLTRQELSDKGDSLYGADQKGALVYITDVSGGSASSQRVNVTSVGYYYFDGLFWQKFVFGSDGMDKTDDEWINDPANTRIHLGKKSDGVTARDARTEFVILDNGKVGIGTSTPNNGSRMHIVGGNSGTGQAFLFLQDGDNANGAAGFSAGVKFRDANNSPMGLVGFDGANNQDMRVYSYNADMFIGTSSGSQGQAIKILNSNQNVLIGRTATANEKLQVNGAIKISTDYSASSITNGATTPVPNGGAGTIIFQNNHFFGWNGTGWKQLDN